MICMCLCVCFFFIGIARANRLTKEQTSALAGRNQSLPEGGFVCECKARN